jgi:hypothetical protein
MFLPLVFACSDDPIYRTGSSDDVIHFSMSVANTAKVYSRSDPNKSDYTKVAVQKLDNAKFPYLFCGVEECYYGNPLTNGGNSRGYIVNDGKEDSSGSKKEGDAIYDKTYKNISVCSFLYKGSSFFDGTEKEQYIGNLDLKTSDGGTDDDGASIGAVVTPEYDYYWPKDDSRKMKFFAVYPSPDEYQPSEGDAADKFAWSYGTDKHTPSITTTVEPNMYNQIDYLFGDADAESGNNVSLTMDHIMTAVQVDLGTGYTLTKNYYIVSVSFENIAIRGTYNAKDGTWTVKDADKIRTCYADINNPSEINGSADKEPNYNKMETNNLYFFMIPQTLSDNAKITIVVWDATANNGAGAEQKIECTQLNQHLGEWTKGTKVRYKVNDKETDVSYEIWPAPTSEQAGVKFDSTTGLPYTTTDSSLPFAKQSDATLACDINGDGKEDINDNFTMFFSYDGTVAGNGDEYTGNVYDLDANGNKQYKTVNGVTTVVTKEVTITDSGCLNVYSVMKETDSKNNVTTTMQPFTIVEDPVTDDKSGVYTSGILKGYTTPFAVPADDYNPLSCNYCTKITLSAQTGTTDTSTGDAYQLEQNANKFIFKNTSGVSTNERTASTADRFLKYVCLSVYRPDIDSNKQWKHWKDGKGNDTQYSSNCYIINYPGFYKIPVVYGPAIQNNGNYELGAIFGTSGTSALGTAVQYNDDKVNSYAYTGWIQYATSGWGQSAWPGNNGYSGAKNQVDTYILWQDVKGEVEVDPYTEKIKPQSDEYYINFRVGVDEDGNVNLDKFKPCNAVIYVTNGSGNILWSYHIWVTPHSYSDKFSAETNPLNSSYSTWEWLDVPIGFEQEAKTVYPARSTRVKLVQTGSGLEATQRIYLVQERHESQPVSCVYYQFGRKDPFPGGKITEESSHMKVDGTYAYGSTDKVIYDGNGNQIIGNDITMDNSGNSVTETATNPPYYRQLGEYGPYDGWEYTDKYTVGYGIKNPNTFVYGYRFPTNDSYWDLWGCVSSDNADTAEGIYPSQNNGTDSRKTIYDPSPIGYKVPAVYLFPAITSDGKNHSSSYSPLIFGINSEDEIYNKESGYANTPYTSHAAFSQHAAFDFYTVRMTPEKAPAVATGTEPKGKTVGNANSTFRIYAFGQINNSDGRISGVGSVGRYWSSTRWSNDNTLTGRALVHQRMDYFEASCNGGSSTFGPAQANTNSYGFPILPARDPTNSPNL